MKKIALLIAGLMASTASMAAVTTQQLAGGQNAVTMVTCDLLANDITITLTSNVTGGFACDNTNNVVALSVCHTKGLTADRSAVVTQNADGSPKCTIIQGSETCVETVTGSSFPSATTENGTVTSHFPGATCTTAETETYAQGLLP